MNETVLNFDSVAQEFYINQPKFDKLNFRKMSQELFDKDCSHFIIKNFIDKDIAMKVRDFYSKTKNSESFIKLAKQTFESHEKVTKLQSQTLNDRIQSLHKEVLKTHAETSTVVSGLKQETTQ